MKTNISPTSQAIVLAFAGVLACSPAFADKPSWAGGGGKGQGQVRSDDVREHRFERDNRVVLDRGDVRILRNNDTLVTRDCPPGLAKKNNGCMPPGQAKKLGYSVGQPLPAGAVISAVPADILRQLGAAPVGHRYVRVGDDVLLVSSATQAVIDVIRHLGRS
jgi:Ni/Co efflux regulator RcnB